MEPVAVCPNFKLTSWPTGYDFQMDVFIPPLLQWVNDTAVDEWTAQPLYNCRTPCVVSASFVCPSYCNGGCCSQSPSKVNYSIDTVSSHYRRSWYRTKLLDKACQKLRGIQDVPSQRITDLEAAIHQMRQLSCILDSCTISASYEVSQAQKAILLMPRTAKGASTSSEELNAQISPRTDEEHNLPAHEDYWQEY